MDGRMVCLSGNRSLPTLSRHQMDPDGSLLVPAALKILQLANVMDLSVNVTVTELTFVRQEALQPFRPLAVTRHARLVNQEPAHRTRQFPLIRLTPIEGAVSDA